MSQAIDKRLERLRQRRKGTDRISILSEQEREEVYARIFVDEQWQTRVSSQQPYTRWVIGAMQAVDATYTRISVETAERVGRQLKRASESRCRALEFKLQGSVPLDIHIRGVSDVDLLALDSDYLTFAVGGYRARTGHYGAGAAVTSIAVLSSLRGMCEEALKSSYPAATIDTLGAKAIKISGGSLPRPVDVVPSHWHDTVEYQSTQQEPDRAVRILDKSVPTTIDNLPFKHIASISERCATTYGGLRKAIRLCKNVKADLEAEGTAVGLSSFDIASIMYHADLGALRNGSFFELAILAEVQRHLDYLWRDQEYAKSLVVPDGTRRIFNTAERLRGLLTLSIDVDQLTQEVWREQNPHLPIPTEPGGFREALSSARIP